MSDHTTQCTQPSSPNLYGAPIFDADDRGRVAGFILERRGVLYLDKRIDEAKHRFRKYNGFGIGDKVLADAIAAGARYAKFHDDQRGTVYLADLSLFRSKGVHVNHGHGGQWILPVKHWTQPADQDTEPTPSGPALAQMALFGGAA